MPDQQALVLLAIGATLILLGAATWRSPLWFYRTGYRWLTFVVGSEFMRPSQRKDKELLFESPADWMARHRRAMMWMRLTTGLGALIMGLLLIGLGIIQWVSKTPR